MVLLFFFYKNNNLLSYKNHNQPFLYAPRLYLPCQSSLKALEKTSNLLFLAYYKVEEENKAKIRLFSEKSLEIAYSFSNKNSNINILFSKDEDHGKDETGVLIKEKAIERGFQAF